SRSRSFRPCDGRREQSPPTIVSRCQRLEFRRIPSAALLERLNNIARSEGIEVEHQVLPAIASVVRGGLRDRISLLDQLSAMTDKRVEVRSAREMLALPRGGVVSESVEALAAADVRKAMNAVTDAAAEFGDVRGLIEELQGALRLILQSSVGRAI